MREKLPEIVFILAIVVDFICGQDYPDTVVQHRTNRRRHHRHRGVLQLGRIVEDSEPRSIPLYEATDIDNEIIMEPINVPHSTEELLHTHFATTSEDSDGGTAPFVDAHPRKVPSRHSRKHHHHRHLEHRRQRKRKKARLKELDEMRKKVAREERRWWRKRKKELQFEEMFFDQETHNPNIIPPMNTDAPCTKTTPDSQESRMNLTSSRIDHFRYHRVTSDGNISHQGEGHALPFVAITDPRPREGIAHKSPPPKSEVSS
ncbi:uncharacterized protein LOC129790580 [Lutzomyia longipalpis]|uniref:uncharacterized protein LOC129790580 n=1 Tax=Lutzomyia longipalpis TaxID=7200 RepID=UPI0024839B63|nr:uncharacterized protein LOC129790580 [Lutzomyia longipalpis]